MFACQEHNNKGLLIKKAAACRMPQPIVPCLITLAAEHPLGIVHMHHGYSTRSLVGVDRFLPAALHHTPFATTWCSGVGAQGQDLGSATRHLSVAYGQQTW